MYDLPSRTDIGKCVIDRQVVLERSTRRWCRRPRRRARQPRRAAELMPLPTVARGALIGGGVGLVLAAVRRPRTTSTIPTANPAPPAGS